MTGNLFEGNMFILKKNFITANFGCISLSNLKNYTPRAKQLNFKYFWRFLEVAILCWALPTYNLITHTVFIYIMASDADRQSLAAAGNFHLNVVVFN